MGVGFAIPIDVHVNIGYGLVIPLGKNVSISPNRLRNIQIRQKYNARYRQSGGGAGRRR